MKKILLTSSVIAACGFGAFGQGTILFENIDNSSAAFTLNSPTGPKTGSGLVVELLWYNGSSFVLEDTFTSTFTGNGSGNPLQLPGQFDAGPVTIPLSGTQTFEVEAFSTFVTGPYYRISAPFTAQVNSGMTPAVSTDSGSWNGDLVLTGPPILPEPSTIALGGLGAVVLWLFRRCK